MAPPLPQPLRSGLTRAADLAWWLLPIAFMLWLYRGGLFTWFLADDFAWLTLLHQVHRPHDLLEQMFTPMAQGTLRPWSERGYFMGLEVLFGLDSLPFRIVAFATAAADLVLIAWLTLRLTRSRIASLLAPVLWLANTALVRVMTWSSSYNELMCAFFLLAALGLFIRYAETGRQRFWWWQLVVFSLGFGALEINIVYPAIAAAWVFFCAPPQRRTRLLRSVAPLAIVSTAYFALHRIVAPLPVSGPYTLHFDWSIVKTIAAYWKWSFVPQTFERYGHSHRAGLVILWIMTVSIVAYLVTEVAAGRRTVVFCLVWFLAPLVPILPFSEHRTDYYLTIPLIGIAIMGAAAAGRFWNRQLPVRGIMAITIGVYLLTMIPLSRVSTNWWLVRSLQVRAIVLGAQAARVSHPGKAIVLDGITSELFNLSLSDSSFAAAEVNGVYLTPESGLTIKAQADGADLESYVLEPAVMQRALTHDKVVVYSLESDHLRNITERYMRSASGRMVDRLPSRIDVGNSLYSWLLGPAWLPSESGVRWMPGSATLRLGIPVNGGSRLELQGHCPEAQLLQAPRHLMVLADGVVIGDTRIYDPESDFERLFPMPAVLAGKTAVDLEIRVDPVVHKDGQDYGLVFGKVAIRP